VARGFVTQSAPNGWLADAAAGMRFLARLPAFLRAPISVADSQAILRRRHAEREGDFLALARRAVYGHPGSPYRALLTHAGCEYRDLERLVRTEGLEGALRALFRAGVFLTIAELKGRRPVVRDGLRLEVDPGALRNPSSAFHVPGQTGGSRGPSTPLAIDLGFVRDVAADLAASLAARGAADWHLAYWDVPGGTIRPLLVCAKAGHAPRRWFSLVDPASRDMHARYRWSARALRWGGRLAGVRLPAPEHVPLGDPLPVVRWMRDVLGAGRTPLLLTYASPAVRLAEAARAAGLDLAGARLLLYGEPVTAARLAAVRRTGAEATPLYIAMETWRLGEGCLAPEASDDVHFLSDLHALVQAGPEGDRFGLPAQALLVTSLRRTAPLALLNVALGDQAVVVDRRCGCPLERLGWTRHLHTIRSYEKLTAGGMTFLDTDVIRVLEETLPARFGGGPTDYQLVEEESAEGLARVRLLMRPEVGPADPEAVAEAFLAAISAGVGVERIMGQVWRDGQLLRVDRQAPISTPSGKILHLHVGGSTTGRPGGP
jgi:hypothetical protein